MNKLRNILKLFSNKKHIELPVNLNTNFTQKSEIFTLFKYSNSKRRNREENIHYVSFGKNSLELIFKKLDLHLSKEMPYVWLRNKCKCDKCYNSHTEEVELDLTEIPVDVNLDKYQLVDFDNLEITCNDNITLKIT